MLMRAGKWLAVIALALAATAAASPKKKEKVHLPDYVLKAQTVLVVIFPDSGKPIEDITANRKAQEEVEKAFMKWGRYRLALDSDEADLVVGVRKGTRKVANPTVNGGPVDSRPGKIETTDNQMRIGVQQGHPPDVSDPTGTQPNSPSDRVHAGIEAGAAEDTFRVFQGGVKYPLENAPVWQLAAKDGLKPPGVTAVEEFQKAVEESEKAAQQQLGQKKSP